MSGKGQHCYQLSPSQLRQAHDLDWKCCSKLFNLPLRVCATVEPDSAESLIPDDVFNQFLKDIEETWEKWASALEVFYDPREPEKGWRLRVHPKYPLPYLYIPPRDRALIGWSASACMEGPSAHLYTRSPCEVNGYLGGIISLSNQNTSTVHVKKDISGPKSWKVYVTHVKLKPGQELFWNYGRANLPIRDNWTLPCCSEVEVNTIASRGPWLPSSRQKMPTASVNCLLCFADLTPKSDYRRQPSNFKGHYARCHLKYFSDCEPIVWDDAMYEIEIFHKVIGGLRSMNYAIRFCCSPGLQMVHESDEARFNEFKKLFTQLRSLNVLLLKGDRVPQGPDDLILEPATKWTKDQSKQFSSLPFTSNRAKAEIDIMEKMVEDRMWNIINHKY